MKKYKDSDWLRQKYKDEGLTAGEIAELCEGSPSTVNRWRKRFGIPRNKRTPGEDKYTDEDWLRKKYSEEGMSTYEIADLLDVSAGAI